MRYDKVIAFTKTEKEYDPDSGEWQEKYVVAARRANVTHTGTQAQSVEFGNVSADRYTVRLLRPYKDAYDYIQIDGERYTPESGYMPSKKRSIVVVRNE